MLNHRRSRNPDLGVNSVEQLRRVQAATLGVATFSYLPYAIFNFASPLLAIAIAYLGVRLLRGPATPEAASETTAAPRE